MAAGVAGRFVSLLQEEPIKAYEGQHIIPNLIR